MGKWKKKEGFGPLLVGDTSKKGGGKLARHMTHQMGLDADIAYISHRRKTQGHRWKHFHNRFTEKFEIKNKLSKNFDVASNYELFKYISSKMDVRAIFVSCRMIQAFDAYDKKFQVKVAGPVVPRSLFLEKIRPSSGHEDHFHLSLSCPKEAKNCTHSWWRDPNKKKRKKKRAKRKKKENLDHYGCPV